MHAKQSHPSAAHSLMPNLPAQQRGASYWRRGVVLAAKGRWQPAARAFAQATQASPADALYWVNLANAQRHAGELDHAESAARRALMLESANGPAMQVLADSLSQMYRPAEALAVFEQLDSAGNHDADSLARHGFTQLQMLRPDLATPLLLRALGMKPDLTLAHALLADAMSDQGFKREAIECMKTVLALEPANLEIRSRLSMEQRQVCDWSTWDADLSTLTECLQESPAHTARNTAVFSLLSLPLRPELLCLAARQEALARTSHVKPLPLLKRPSAAPARIRVGWLSFDFRDHPVAQLLVEVLEKLDRSRFEVFLYSNGPEDTSGLRQRLQATADSFVDIRGLSDSQAAQRMRDDGVLLLIDLMGFTRGARPAILAHRPAPVQAGYLGFPCTSGADYIDYIVADDIVAPAALAHLYTEKLAQLPVCLQPNGRWRPLPQPMTRADAGLPEDAFVLCAFNQTPKIGPANFDAWCRVLHQLPNAVLWLHESNGQLRDNVRREIHSRGIDPQRVYYARRVSYADHFSRLALADVFLDSWPYNGHTTVSDALWAGVPVLTLAGNSYASRVAASALNAAGLGELAFMDVEDYVNAAVVLASDAALLAGYQQHLRANRMSLPLFDSASHALELGNLFERMVQRWMDGLGPDHLWALPQATAPDQQAAAAAQQA